MLEQVLIRTKPRQIQRKAAFESVLHFRLCRCGIYHREIIELRLKRNGRTCTVFNLVRNDFAFIVNRRANEVSCSLLCKVSIGAYFSSCFSPVDPTLESESEQKEVISLVNNG